MASNFPSGGISEERVLELIAAGGGGVTLAELEAAIDELEASLELYIGSEIASLRSPTWTAVDSTDSQIVYGGYKTTGVIRKRNLETGVDTFFTSTDSLPIPDEASWVDWQSRETLVYT